MGFALSVILYHDPLVRGLMAMLQATQLQIDNRQYPPSCADSNLRFDASSQSPARGPGAITQISHLAQPSVRARWWVGTFRDCKPIATMIGRAKATEGINGKS